MISTYGGVLSAIKKTLQDLVEGQERNIAQLERIGAMMEQKWSSEEESMKEESRDDTEGSEDGPREIQEEETLSSTFC